MLRNASAKSDAFSSRRIASGVITIDLDNTRSQLGAPVVAVAEGHADTMMQYRGGEITVMVNDAVIPRALTACAIARLAVRARFHDHVLPGRMYRGEN